MNRELNFVEWIKCKIGDLGEIGGDYGNKKRRYTATSCKS